jgi:hypothetical protein
VVEAGSARSHLIGSVAWAAALVVGAGAPPVRPDGLRLRRVAFLSLLDSRKVICILFVSM